MRADRFNAITDQYSALRIAVVGDFCLDRYLEIDPSRKEISIETGLPVHNVVKVRAQPGGAGTIVNNLSALGVGTIYPVGFCGLDGEGYELVRSLKRQPGVTGEYFVQTRLRRTFTYCKPLVIEEGKPPRELNRLDSKNWDPTPKSVQDKLVALLHTLSSNVDAMIILDQVDVAETGVVTARLLDAIGALARARPNLPIFGDCRRGLKGYPPISLKMNRVEFAALTGARADFTIEELKTRAGDLARRQHRPVFITLAEAGIVGASPDGEVEHSPAQPLRGEIDVVGAGDAVTANLAAASAAGATLDEALALANAAASIVIHQLGTTGTATVAQIQPFAAPDEDQEPAEPAHP